MLLATVSIKGLTPHDQISWIMDWINRFSPKHAAQEKTVGVCLGGQFFKKGDDKLQQGVLKSIYLWLQ